MPSIPIHSSIIALVSLSAGIASKHPNMGMCQLEKLRSMGITDDQLDIVIEIARHIRDEAGQKLDIVFDQAARAKTSQTTISDQITAEACCTPTTSGHSCC